MRQSLMSVIFAAALLLKCYATSAGLPTDNDSLEPDAFPSLLGDEVAESSLGGDAAEAAAVATRARGPRLIVIAADPNLWRDLRVLHGAGVHKRRADDVGPADHRDVAQDLSIPILRRDTMRCMVGRVYRPCWEV